MRIPMLGHKRIPSREGGIEIVVDELSTHMAALGHSVTAYNRKGRHVSGGKVQKLKEYKGREDQRRLPRLRRVMSKI